MPTNVSYQKPSLTLGQPITLDWKHVIIPDQFLTDIRLDHLMETVMSKDLINNEVVPHFGAAEHLLLTPLFNWAENILLLGKSASAVREMPSLVVGLRKQSQLLTRAYREMSLTFSKAATAGFAQVQNAMVVAMEVPLSVIETELNNYKAKALPKDASLNLSPAVFSSYAWNIINGKDESLSEPGTVKFVCDIDFFGAKDPKSFVAHLFAVGLSGRGPSLETEELNFLQGIQTTISAALHKLMDMISDTTTFSRTSVERGKLISEFTTAAYWFLAYKRISSDEPTYDLFFPTLGITGQDLATVTASTSLIAKIARLFLDLSNVDVVETVMIAAKQYQSAFTFAEKISFGRHIVDLDKAKKVNEDLLSMLQNLSMDAANDHADWVIKTISNLAQLPTECLLPTRFSKFHLHPELPGRPNDPIVPEPFTGYLGDAGIQINHLSISSIDLVVNQIWADVETLYRIAHAIDARSMWLHAFIDAKGESGMSLLSGLFTQSGEVMRTMDDLIVPSRDQALTSVFEAHANLTEQEMVPVHVAPFVRVPADKDKLTLISDKRTRSGAPTSGVKAYADQAVWTLERYKYKKIRKDVLAEILFNQEASEQKFVWPSQLVFSPSYLMAPEAANLPIPYNYAWSSSTSRIENTAEGMMEFLKQPSLRPIPDVACFFRPVFNSAAMSQQRMAVIADALSSIGFLYYKDVRSKDPDKGWRIVPISFPSLFGAPIKAFRDMNGADGLISDARMSGKEAGKDLFATRVIYTNPAYLPGSQFELRLLLHNTVPKPMDVTLLTHVIKGGRVIHIPMATSFIHSVMRSLAEGADDLVIKIDKNVGSVQTGTPDARRLSMQYKAEYIHASIIKQATQEDITSEVVQAADLRWEHLSHWSPVITAFPAITCIAKHSAECVSLTRHISAMRDQFGFMTDPYSKLGAIAFLSEPELIEPTLDDELTIAMNVAPVKLAPSIKRTIPGVQHASEQAGSAEQITLHKEAASTGDILPGSVLFSSPNGKEGPGDASTSFRVTKDAPHDTITLQHRSAAKEEEAKAEMGKPAKKTSPTEDPGATASATARGLTGEPIPADTTTPAADAEDTALSTEQMTKRKARKGDSDKV